MQNEKDPLSEREQLYLEYPEWFVDYVLAPFPDEVGAFVVTLKWLTVAWILCEVYLALFPAELASNAAFGLMLTGIVLLIALPFLITRDH